MYLSLGRKARALTVQEDTNLRGSLVERHGSRVPHKPINNRCVRLHAAESNRLQSRAELKSER